MSDKNKIVSENAVGKLSQETDESVVVWKISNFTKKLSDPPDTEYHSPAFAFSDRCWVLRIYPNGDEREISKGYTGLYLLKGKQGCKISFTLCVRNAKGVAEFPGNAERTFDSSRGFGWPQFCAKSTWMDRKSELLPDDNLTVECRLERNNSSLLRVSRIVQLLNLQRDWKKILTEKETCDLTFKVGGQEIKAHKGILEKRSKYFESMFVKDKAERASRNCTCIPSGNGEGTYILGRKAEAITIKDIKSDVFQEVLAYMYSGEVENLSTENICQIYEAAHRFQIDDLKRLCAAFIEENLSVDLLCAILVIPDKCIDAELVQLLKEYFSENLMNIIETEKWKHFHEKNKDTTREVLFSTLKANFEEHAATAAKSKSDAAMQTVRDTGVAPSELEDAAAAAKSKTDVAMQTIGDTGVVPSELEDAVILRDEFETLYQTGEFCDFDVKVQDRIFRTHKVVLAARSPALASMLSHDMKEKKTGMVEIVDCDSESFEDFLKFLYCGKYDVIVPKNVVNLYEVANKYQVQNLKAKCLCFMMDNLSTELFCDVMCLALKHGERDLIKRATKYFKRNKKSIFLSVEWQIFLKENTTYGNELLIKTCC